jgi:hypothetical protein
MVYRNVQKKKAKNTEIIAQIRNNPIAESIKAIIILSSVMKIFQSVEIFDRSKSQGFYNIHNQGKNCGYE